ncbi:MAG: hypothetical protein K1X55_09955 [Chitinophagales bacterium]|nr:hypothetical protein [Chitinophagales bacterium]
MEGRILSTYRILKEKACNADIDESWAEWAIEMMQAGYENENLYQLAGISNPYNQFELQELTSKVLNDLNLDYYDKRETLKNYIYYLVSANFDKPNNYFVILKEFRDIYYELDMDSEFQNLALLYWAKDDLIYEDNQHYWDGANRANIDTIIRHEFEYLKQKFETEK